MLFKTFAIFTALTFSAQASTGSSLSRHQEDVTPFEELNSAIHSYQEAVDDKGSPLHKDPASITFRWPCYSSLSPFVLNSLSHVIRLNLGNNLTKIPETISCLKQLKTLRLSIATWDVLPDSLGTMDHLRDLTIVHATIGRVPAFLKKLTGLERLSFNCSLMNFSSLQEAHDFFTVFQGLTSLHLGKRGENCAVIPRSIADLESLERFSVSSELTTFELVFNDSFHVKNFKALQDFLKTQGDDYGRREWADFKEQWQEEDASEKRDYGKRQESLLSGDATTPLTTVDLDMHNGVLPKALYRFPSLTDLTVGSFLTEIPEGISALKQLKTLTLSLGNGELLPSDLGDLPSLKVLTLTHMRKGDYVRHTGLNRLTQLEELNLHCSHTKLDLTSLFADLTQLKVLHLGDHAPKALGRLTSLQRLDLNSAKIPGFEMPHLHTSLTGDDLERALAYIRSDAYNPDALTVAVIDDAPYKGKGKGERKSKKEDSHSPAASSSTRSIASSSTQSAFLKEDPQKISPSLSMPPEEKATTLEAVRYALAALNGITFNHQQTVGIDLAHHLKMCETLVNLTRHLKENA